MQVDDQAIFKVRLFREDLNFSAGHISIYGGSIEGHHGHNYGISVEIEGPLNQDSLVIDFRAVKKVLKSIKAQMNHRTGSVSGMSNWSFPLATWFFSTLPMSRLNCWPTTYTRVCVRDFGLPT